MDIIFKNFLIPNQIFFSQQVKRSVIISNKHEFGDKGVTTEVRSLLPLEKGTAEVCTLPPEPYAGTQPIPPNPAPKAPHPPVNVRTKLNAPSI